MLLAACLAGVGLFGVWAAGGSARADDKDKPVVVLETSEGNITLELDRAKAPKTVDNFLKYVDDGFYNDTIFHRVIPGFMIQGGGHAKDTGKEKKTRGSVKNESGNGLSNARGTIAMARKQDPDSATAQFFINLADNSRLDNAGGGYTTFGKVTGGMDVVDKIARVQTGTAELEMSDPPIKIPAQDVPTKQVVIKSAKRKSS